MSLRVPPTALIGLAALAALAAGLILVLAARDGGRPPAAAAPQIPRTDAALFEVPPVPPPAPAVIAPPPAPPGPGRLRIEPAELAWTVELEPAGPGSGAIGGNGATGGNGVGVIGGELAAARRVRLVQDGETAVRIDRVQLLGDAAWEVDQGCAGQRLAPAAAPAAGGLGPAAAPAAVGAGAGDGAVPSVRPVHGGAACALTLRFRPTMAGRYGAVLQVIHDGPDRIAEAPLVGAAGLRLPPAPDELQVRLAAQRFGRAAAAADRIRLGLSLQPADGPDGTAAATGVALGGAAVIVAPPADPAAPAVGRRPVEAAAPATGWDGYPRVTASVPVDRSRIITNDRFIPAILETEINSQIAGRVTAVVELPVFGASGRNVLIEPGSRLVGDYQSLQRQGQTRILVVWRRILRPDGSHVLISDPSADQIGRTGLPGDVDNRIWERFGFALLISVIQAIASGGAALADGGVTVSPVGTGASVIRESPSGRAAREGAAALNQNLTRTAEAILRETVSLAPIVTVPEGTRFVVMPLTDIHFPAPDQEGRRAQALDRGAAAREFARAAAEVSDREGGGAMPFAASATVGAPVPVTPAAGMPGATLPVPRSAR